MITYDMVLAEFERVKPEDYSKFISDALFGYDLKHDYRSLDNLYKDVLVNIKEWYIIRKNGRYDAWVWMGGSHGFGGKGNTPTEAILPQVVKGIIYRRLLDVQV